MLSNFTSVLFFFLQTVTEMDQRQLNRDLNITKGVATFLHKTYRYGNAIRFYKEFLVLLNLFSYKLPLLECSIYMRLALANFCLGDLKEAIEMGKKALEVSKSTEEKGYQGNACRILSFLYFEQGESDKAIEYQEKLLDISRANGNNEKIEVLYYMTMGIIYSRDKGLYSKSSEYFERGLKMSKACGLKEEERAFYCYLAGVHMALGQFEKSIACNNAALEMSKAIGNRGQCDGTAYAQLGMAYNSLGQNEQSVHFYKKAIKVFKKTGWAEGQGVYYCSLGALYHDLAQYNESISYLQEALRIFKTCGSRQGELACYINLGMVFQPLCQYEKSVEVLEEALALSKSCECKRFEATCYHNLGCVFSCTGQYERSIDCLEEGLRISKEIGDGQGEGASLNSLGNVYFAIGQWGKSIKYGKKGLNCCESFGNKLGEAEALNHLGCTYSAMGQYEPSLEYFSKALEISKETSNKYNEARSYCGIGTVFCSLGDHEKSVVYLEKSIEMFHAIGAQRAEAFSCANLGVTYHSLGLLEKSVECQERALEIFRENGNKGDVSGPLANLGLIHAVEFQSFQLATAFFTESVKTRHTIRGTLADELKLCLDDKLHSIISQKMLCFLQVAQGKAEDALCSLEQGRARALVDLMTTKYGINEEESQEVNKTILRKCLEKKESNFLCLAKLSRCVYIWFVRRSGKIHFKKTFLNMDPCPSVADYFFSDAMKPCPPLLNGKELSGKIENRSLSALYDGKSSNVDNMSTELTDDHRRPDTASGPKSPNDHEVLQNYSLYNIIISSVFNLIEGPEIVIAPEGPLFLVPFAALQDGSGKYLSETVRIRLVPSLTTLKLIQDSPPDYHSTTGALVVGDPKVGRVKVNGKVTRLCRLPSAKEEAQMVSRLLEVSCLVAEKASKDEVLRRIKEVSLVHIAAHGDAERGEIALAPNSSVVGIPKKDDFMLTMKDIAEVGIRAKLVTLSCCHSGCGKILTAEGVVGIARAFLGSGARSVLMSLWAVDDQSTKEFMEIFYTGLIRERLSASEALHQAMKKMRESPQQHHNVVRNWAPFVLLGDNVSFDFRK